MTPSGSLAWLPVRSLTDLLVLAEKAATDTTPEHGLRGHLFAEGLILFGALFILVAAFGMLRFPDFYIRLHASTKLVALGGLGILGGAALAFSAVGASERVLLIAAFFLLTAPLSGYMIAHAGYLSGLEPHWEESSVDEWQECGALAGLTYEETVARTAPRDESGST